MNLSLPESLVTRRGIGDQHMYNVPFSLHQQSRQSQATQITLASKEIAMQNLNFVNSSTPMPIDLSSRSLYVQPNASLWPSQELFSHAMGAASKRRSPPTVDHDEKPVDLRKTKTLQQACNTPAESASGGNNKSHLEALFTSVAKKRLNAEEPLNLSKKQKTNCFENGVVAVQEAVNNPVQFVQLAPSSLDDVKEKVSAWLIEIIRRAHNLEHFSDLQQHDKVCLLLNSWHRLILWLMASSEFSFNLMPIKSTADNMDKLTSITLPSMAFVKNVGAFVNKFKTLQIDDRELTFLYYITLFHNGYHMFNSSKSIDTKKRELMRDLQKYILSKANSSSQRYSQLLLFLPSAYGINEKMFEKLFFPHLAGKVEVKVLLKEIIKDAPHRWTTSDR